MGVNAASYLTNWSLKQLDQEHGQQYPRIRGFLLTHTYVDDIVLEANSVEIVQERKIRQEDSSLLAQEPILLKKCLSNSMLNY